MILLTSATLDFSDGETPLALGFLCESFVSVLFFTFKARKSVLFVCFWGVDFVLLAASRSLLGLLHLLGIVGKVFVCCSFVFLMVLGLCLV